MPEIRPLRRVGDGVWRSRNERWTFLRHNSDPHPQRWFAYLDEDPEPCMEATLSLREAVWEVERFGDAQEADADSYQSGQPG